MTKVWQKLPLATFPVATSQRLVVVVRRKTSREKMRRMIEEMRRVRVMMKIMRMMVMVMVMRRRMAMTKIMTMMIMRKRRWRR